MQKIKKKKKKKKKKIPLKIPEHLQEQVLVD